MFLASTIKEGEESQNFFYSSVYMFSEMRIWREKIRPSLREYQEQLRRFDSTVQPSMATYAGELNRNINTLCRDDSAFYVDVVISRSGIAEITVPAIPHGSTPSVSALPRDSRKRDNVIRVLSSQSLTEKEG